MSKVKTTITTVVLSMLLALAFSLSGCDSVRDSLREGNRSTELVVQYATLKAIGGDAEKADRAREIIARVRADIDRDDSVALSELRSRVEGEVRWDRLDAADQLLVMTLIDVAFDHLDDAVGEGFISDDDRASVNQMLDWVEGALRLI